METHLKIPTLCPGCRKPLDGATSTYRDAAPSPGDPTVCVYCAAVLVFEEALTLREVTPEDMARFSDDHRRAIERVRRLATRMIWERRLEEKLVESSRRRRPV